MPSSRDRHAGATRDAVGWPSGRGLTDRTHGEVEAVAAIIPQRFRGRARRDAAAFYLSELAKGLLAGELLVSDRGQTVLATSEYMLLDIEVKQKKRGYRVQVTVCWPRDPPVPVGAPRLVARRTTRRAAQAADVPG